MNHAACSCHFILASIWDLFSQPCDATDYPLKRTDPGTGSVLWLSNDAFYGEVAIEAGLLPAADCPTTDKVPLELMLKVQTLVAVVE
jgi:hypothetical protein